MFVAVTTITYRCRNLSTAFFSVCRRFDENNHNCFSFCLHFVNGVLAAEGRGTLSRDDFTHTFILPRMRRVSKYTTLYRHIQKHQFYTVDRQQHAQGAEPSS